MWISVFVIHWLSILSENCRQSLTKNINNITKTTRQCSAETVKVTIKD